MLVHGVGSRRGDGGDAGVLRGGSAAVQGGAPGGVQRPRLRLEEVLRGGTRARRLRPTLLMTDERRISQGSSHELIVQHERPGCHAPAHTTPHGRIFHVFPSQKEQKEKEQKNPREERKWRHSAGGRKFSESERASDEHKKQRAAEREQQAARRK